MNKKAIEISIHWDVKISTSYVQNKGLYESLGLDPVTIHKVFFGKWKTFLLSDNLPQNIPLSNGSKQDESF